MNRQSLSYSDGPTVCNGVLVRPDTQDSSSPGVLIVHDVRGVGLNPQRHVEELVARGFVVLAVDMFGTVPRDFDHGRQLIGELLGSIDAWRRRIAAALVALQAVPGVNSSRVAAVGYCFGGATVLELALSGAEIRAAVSMHGGLDRISLQNAADIRASLLVCTGAEDPLIPAATVQALQSALREGGVADWQIVTISQAKHSFTNEQAPDTPATGYNKRADDLSLAAMLNLLDARLGKP